MKYIIVFIFIALFINHSQAKTYALVVGINHYKDSTSNLYYSVADATSFKKYLEGIHKKKDSLEIIFITDSFATLNRIKFSLKYLSKKARKSDKLIMYISSHGTPSGGSTSFDYSSNGYRTIDYDFVKKTFDSSAAKMKYIFIENCYSGQMIEKVFQRDSLSSDNYFVFCSSKASEVSWWSSSVENGYFTQYLIDGLTTNKGDLDKNKRITIDELYKFVRDNTLRETNGKQTPTIYGKFKSNIVIGKYK